MFHFPEHKKLFKSGFLLLFQLRKLFPEMLGKKASFPGIQEIFAKRSMVNIWQNSEYVSGSEYTRVLNMPFPKYKKVPFRKYKKVSSPEV